MKRLLIVGAGGFGRELYSYCLTHPGNATDWFIGGFIDDNREALAGLSYPVGVVSGISDYIPLPEDVLVCALGDPEGKKKICQNLLERGCCFMNLIHPSALVGHNVKLGIGIVMCPGSAFTCDVEVGDFVTVNCGSGSGHDSRIGSFSTISACCAIGGGVKLGDLVMVGAHATLLPRITVGAGAIIGTGAVVIANVKPGETVYGNPARTLMMKKTATAEEPEKR